MFRYGLSLIFAVTTAIANTGCSKNDSNWNLASIYPYIEDTPYAPVLVVCANAKEPHESCHLTTLPTIAMSSPQVSIDDVMERVLVSDDWMGLRFRQLLEVMPEDLITLFGAVTAIVIDKDIRPSYYDPVTGAIYIDPLYVWQTQEELSVINLKHDYRAAFASPMSFRSLWRLTRNGRSVDDYQLTPEGSRNLSDITVSAASLLFHELAHANDFLAISNYDTLNLSDTFYAAVVSQAEEFPSQLLTTQYKLESTVMNDLADILYLGVSPSEAYTLMGPAEVGENFQADRASDDYAYASQFEDLAMLFEEAMIKIHFDVDRDTAFSSAPGENGGCEQLIIGWGVRNRIGEPSVKARAQFVFEAIYPDRDFSAELNSLPDPTQLPTGVGWCNYLNPDAVQSGKPGSEQFGQQPLPYQDMLRPYE